MVESRGEELAFGNTGDGPVETRVALEDERLRAEHDPSLGAAAATRG